MVAQKPSIWQRLRQQQQVLMTLRQQGFQQTPHPVTPVQPQPTYPPVQQPVQKVTPESTNQAMDNGAESRSRNPRTGHQRKIKYYSHKTKKETYGQSKSGTGENDELKGVVALRRRTLVHVRRKKTYLWIYSTKSSFASKSERANHDQAIILFYSFSAQCSNLLVSGIFYDLRAVSYFE